MGAANIGNDNPMIRYTIVPHNESANYANRWASSACPCRFSAFHSARLVLIGGLQRSLIHTLVVTLCFISYCHLKYRQFKIKQLNENCVAISVATESKSGKIVAKVIGNSRKKWQRKYKHANA
jgi:hypothetical protein